MNHRDGMRKFFYLRSLRDKLTQPHRFESTMDRLPHDPAILLSYVNTLLRDKYTSLDDLCASLDIDEGELKQKLSVLHVEYVCEINQFR